MNRTELVDKDITLITTADIMTTYQQLLDTGMTNGKKFQEKYFSQITGCVHAIYKYAMTFEHLPIIDLPKSIDCSMLSFRQAGQTNDDIIAEALTKSQLGRAFVWCSEHCDDIVVLALWLNFYLGLRFAELYALRW